MDIKLEKKPWYIRYRYYLAGGILFLAFIIYFFFILLFFILLFFIFLFLRYFFICWY